MDSYDRRRLMEWTHRKAASLAEYNHRAAPSSSSSSLSSRDSSSGSVGRKRKSTLNHRRRSCGNIQSSSLLLQKPRVLRDHHPSSLPRCRRSAPMLRNQRAFDIIAAPSNSTLNKRWDEFTAIKIKKRCPSKAIYSDDRRAPISLVKSPSDPQTRTETKAKKSLRFDDTSNLIHYNGPMTTEPNNASWYSSSDLSNFQDQVRARAETTRRMMSYAATYDATYNSATGLTSSHALGEYLSSPADVVGIECLLAGQGTARSSLIRYHRKALLEGQFDVYDSERVGNDSRIAAHMAKERAAYALRL